ncbi:HAD family hydrolase, partial [Myceligenerans halotolerans]
LAAKVSHLHTDKQRLVAHNDIPMLEWAARGVAMQHAPAVVHRAADETTGSIDAAGVVTVLHSLTPAAALDPGLSPLAAQLTAAVHTATGSLTSVRVWHGTNTDLAGAEIWTHHTGTWLRHSPIPAARGATMRDMENAAHEARLDFPRGFEGKRRAQWRSTTAVVVGRHSERPAGFELPLTPTT